jgi:hypothetical protein
LSCVFHSLPGNAERGFRQTISTPAFSGPVNLTALGLAINVLCLFSDQLLGET